MARYRLKTGSVEAVELAAINVAHIALPRGGVIWVSAETFRSLFEPMPESKTRQECDGQLWLGDELGQGEADALQDPKAGR